MKDFGMKGTISVTSGNWHFENLYVDYDKDKWINLQIYSWQILRGSYIFSEFGKIFNISKLLRSKKFKYEIYLDIIFKTC